MRLTLPTPADLSELTDHRDEPSVSIYLPSSPLPTETDAVKIALKNAINDAEAQLAEIGMPKPRITALGDTLRALESDREFWQNQSRAIAVFAAPGVMHAFRLANDLQSQVSVGDRFDIGTLLRSVTFPHGGFVLSVTEGDVHLLELSANQHPVELDLPGLPADLHTVLEYTTTSGRFDRESADGATGQRIEQQRYCRLVQDAVLDRIGDTALPLVLAASRALEPAYREINSYPGLLDRGIQANPESLTIDELDARTREILDGHYAAELSQWRELFGTQHSNGLATSQLGEVARAATAGAVDGLFFDIDSTLEGTIDDVGVVHSADAPGPTTYGIVDEVAARVLRSGGTVKAVRAADLPDDSPVAATLRYAL
ncbi:baeRF11 domain-containing protein [Homoserinimonas sp. A520]